MIDNQFYETDCYIRGINLVAKYNYWNGNKSDYTYYTQNAHGDGLNLTDSLIRLLNKFESKTNLIVCFTLIFLTPPCHHETGKLIRKRNIYKYKEKCIVI